MPGMSCKPIKQCWWVTHRCRKSDPLLEWSTQGPHSFKKGQEVPTPIVAREGMQLINNNAADAA